MSYLRALPRDLFNEAKLLKCLGRLSLCIFESNDYNLRLEHDDDAFSGFLIEQDSDDGCLFCSNLTLFQGENYIPLYTLYNSKDDYPLMFEDDEGNPHRLFEENGDFSVEFTKCFKGYK